MAEPFRAFRTYRQRRRALPRRPEEKPSSGPSDADSERILLQVDKPQFNHNGGAIAFGPDGKLYIYVGDGGGANDVGLGHVEDWYPDNATRQTGKVFRLVQPGRR